MWNLSKIPKKAHFYWGNKTLPLGRFLSVASFALENKDWEVNLHVPVRASENLKKDWDTEEHKFEISNSLNECYFGNIEQLTNVNIIKHSFEKLDYLSDVHKSDYLRWGIMASSGGVWSDIDILYISSMENLILNHDEGIRKIGFNIKAEDVKEIICCDFSGGMLYNSIGFLLSSESSVLFEEVRRRCNGLLLINFGQKFLEYQELGRDVLDATVDISSFLNHKPQYRQYVRRFYGGHSNPSSCFIEANDKYRPINSAINLPMDVVYPYLSFQAGRMLDSDILRHNLITENTIGVHWFGGHPKVGRYMSRVNRESVKQLPPCVLSNIITEIIERHEIDLFPA